MENEQRTKVCIVCKRTLPAAEEFFLKQKKGKYGFGDLCAECREQRKLCGDGSKWRKRGNSFYK